ncbi:MAG: flagellin FliC [Acidobacteria bacterium]|nr:flagellin FliC [Acidobacteriota bacterium]
MASFSVVNNISSVNAQSKLYETNIGLSRTLARLSSGLRINQSGDDAAGLAVANKFRSDVAILTVGVRNANDGLSSLQIADGALDNISRLLDRAATLAAQSATGTTTADSRTVLQQEFAEILTEIDREAGIASLTTATSYSIYISNDGANGTVAVSFGAATASTLGISSATIATSAGASSAVTSLQAAITALGTVQGSVGSAENRLGFAVSIAQSQIVNKTAAQSRIRDANIAEESANLTRFNILTQSGLASLSQANQTTSSVLSLLR